MILGFRKPFFYMLLATLLIGGTLVSFRYLHAFQYQGSTVVPDNISVNTGHMNLQEGNNIFSLPLDAAVDNLLNNRKILSVKLDYDLPGQLKIKLNDIRPLALILGADKRTLYCIDKYGYIYHFDSEQYGFDYPIITGLKKSRLYNKTDDDQIIPALSALDHLMNDDYEAYLTVSGINLTKEGYLAVHVDGLPFAVLTYAGSLYESIIQTRQFISGANLDLENIKQLDLRSDGLIIAVK